MLAMSSFFEILWFWCMNLKITGYDVVKMYMFVLSRTLGCVAHRVFGVQEVARGKVEAEHHCFSLLKVPIK